MNDVEHWRRCAELTECFTACTGAWQVDNMLAALLEGLPLTRLEPVDRRSLESRYRSAAKRQLEVIGQGG